VAYANEESACTRRREGCGGASRTPIARADVEASPAGRLSLSRLRRRRFRTRAARRWRRLPRGRDAGLEASRRGLRDLRGGAAVASARLVVDRAPPGRLPRDLRVELDRLASPHPAPRAPRG